MLKKAARLPLSLSLSLSLSLRAQACARLTRCSRPPNRRRRGVTRTENGRTIVEIRQEHAGDRGSTFATLSRDTREILAILELVETETHIDTCGGGQAPTPALRDAAAACAARAGTIRARRRVPCGSSSRRLSIRNESIAGNSRLAIRFFCQKRSANRYRAVGRHFARRVCPRCACFGNSNLKSTHSHLKFKS